MQTLLCSAVFWSSLWAVTWGHARLMSPAARSSMWRLGFQTEKNFDDDGIDCGGVKVQWERNGGKCGICGDPYHMPQPRDNEAGGKYGRGIITKRYRAGQMIEATVDVTASHRGYFEFRVCPNNNPKKEVSQDCLDKHLLKLVDGGTRYNITGRGNGNLTVKLRLPKGLTCPKCVFQWTYVAGNNWGRCDNGESRLGCGPQETFRNCADISIQKHDNIFIYKPDQNEIRGSKASTSSSYYKIIKQKLQKETSQYPTYTTEFTGQTFENNSTFITGDSTKEGKSNQPFTMRMTTDTTEMSSRSTASTKPKSHGHSFRFQNRNGDYIPAVHRSSGGRLFNKDKVAFSGSPAVLVVDKGTRLSNMFQHLQEEMELLRFYLQEDPAVASEEDISTGQSTGSSRIVKDFWYL